MSGVRPIFLLSLPRAGSTLLQRLLLADGRCATLGEPSLLLRFLGEGDVMTRRSTYWEVLVDTATADMRAAWDGYDETYRKGIRELVTSIYQGLAGGKEWFLDKTPRYTLIAEELIRTFPDAKFIVLWRHPLAVAASISSTFRKGRWCPDEFAIDLYEGQARLQAFAEKHAGSICQVRYEDLVSDPAGELEKIGAYLGWDGLLDVAERELVPTAGGSLGDPTGVKKYQKVSSASREAWKAKVDNWYRRAWVKRYVSGERAEHMRRLGYELPPELVAVPWWAGRPLAGVADWLAARRRIHRRLRQPTWLPRFAKKFRREHGYEIIFR
ncbi:MAG TPA: sulfotransferase [Luteolibacter sp.]